MCDSCVYGKDSKDLQRVCFPLNSILITLNSKSLGVMGKVQVIG